MGLWNINFDERICILWVWHWGFHLMRHLEDPESCAVGGGDWFSNQLIITDIKLVRFLSSLFVSLTSTNDTVAWWTSWFSILVCDLVRIRLLKRRGAFFGAIVIFLFEGKTVGLKTEAVHVGMMSCDTLMQFLTSTQVWESKGDGTFPIKFFSLIRTSSLQTWLQSKFHLITTSKELLIRDEKR